MEIESPKLVGFSDSREDAASQAFGIEKEHFRDVVRALFLKCIEQLSSPDSKILELVEEVRKKGINAYSNYKEIPNAEEAMWRQ